MISHPRCCSSHGLWVWGLWFSLPPALNLVRKLVHFFKKREKNSLSHLWFFFPPSFNSIYLLFSSSSLSCLENIKGTGLLLQLSKFLDVPAPPRAAGGGGQEIQWDQESSGRPNKKRDKIQFKTGWERPWCKQHLKVMVALVVILPNGDFWNSDISASLPSVCWVYKLDFLNQFPKVAPTDYKRFPRFWVN